MWPTNSKVVYELCHESLRTLCMNKEGEGNFTDFNSCLGNNLVKDLQKYRWWCIASLMCVRIGWKSVGLVLCLICNILLIAVEISFLFSNKTSFFKLLYKNSSSTGLFNKLVDLEFEFLTRIQCKLSFSLYRLSGSCWCIWI